MPFPKEFHFGVCSAAYQVEGAIHEGDKLPSIWDVYSHTPGKIKNGENGDIAIDFYHRYKEDIVLAKELGVDTFRFSLAWTRLVKQDGSTNEAGVKFYRQVLEEIHRQGLRPVITLYHWDLPQYLEDRGGWKERSIIDDFLTYVRVAKENFLDLCQDYLTFNEPQCFLYLGYQNLGHAPGKVYTVEEMMRAAHNVLMCHFKAQRLLEEGHPEVHVGFVNTMNGVIPEDDSVALWEEIKKHFFAPPKTAQDFYTQSIYMDPLYLHHYPKEVEEYMEEHHILQPGDLDLIRNGKEDTVYLNLYTANHCYVDKKGLYHSERRPTKENQGFLEWLIKEPKTLYYTPKLIQERYHLPIVISENGDAVEDTLTPDGHIHDPRRSEYLLSYLGEMEKAIQDGVDIRGYFYWSLCDNFEWAEGFGPRFGLVYIDYKNGLKRIKKDSFTSYQTFIKEHH